jgi:hypothetical protein
MRSSSLEHLDVLLLHKRLRFQSAPMDQSRRASPGNPGAAFVGGNDGRRVLDRHLRSMTPTFSAVVALLSSTSFR